MVNMATSYRCGPRFKSQQGRELLILNKKELSPAREASEEVANLKEIYFLGVCIRCNMCKMMTEI